MGLLATTVSLSSTRSQPSLFFRRRIIWPLRGKLVYFWAGLTRYKPYCVHSSFNVLVVLPFPHSYLMLPFISFTHFQFLPLLLLHGHTWAFHTNHPQVEYNIWSSTDLGKTFSILSTLSSLASSCVCQQTVGGQSVIVMIPGALLSLLTLQPSQSELLLIWPCR